ncbi:hypothetical protein Tco_1174138 [Tanacetum coccineum]
MLHPNRLSLPSFEKHLEEKHVTWARFGKKRDKKTTLQDFDGALDLQCVEKASQSSLTLSKLEGDDVIIFCDDVTVADLKNPIEDSVGSRRQDLHATTSYFSYFEEEKRRVFL